jgi:hypothetical protein
MFKRMNNSLKVNWPLMAMVAIVFLFYGEFMGNGYLGTLYPGYDWKTDSISYLGQQNSPVLHYVKNWGICFTITYIILGLAFYKSFNHKSFIVKIVSVLFVVYGFGEGVGSSFFPINEKGSALTQSAFLHNLFGGFADVALYAIPFLMLFEFSKSRHFKFHITTYVLMGVALIACFIFLIAKYFHIEHGVFTYRGVWQRIFLLCFYIYFLLLMNKLPKGN